MHPLPHSHTKKSEHHSPRHWEWRRGFREADPSKDGKYQFIPTSSDRQTRGSLQCPCTKLYSGSEEKRKSCHWLTLDPCRSLPWVVLSIVLVRPEGLPLCFPSNGVLRAKCHYSLQVQSYVSALWALLPGEKKKSLPDCGSQWVLNLSLGLIKSFHLSQSCSSLLGLWGF